MGRGRSGRTSSPQTRQRPTRPQPQQPQQQQRQRRTPQEWYDYFRTANDAQATAALNEWRQERMDDNNRSNDNDIQRFFHNIGWTENTPVALDERQYQAALRAAGNPQQLYHSDQDRPHATAQDFAAQYFGQTPYRHYISNGIHGGGTYFATTASESANYGNNQFRGFLNSKANVISESRLQREYNAFANAHPAFKRMMAGIKTGYGRSKEKLSIFAAMRGYNVIYDRSSDYYVVLDRSVTTVSTQQRRANWGMRDW